VSDPAKIRARIEQCKQNLARREGEAETLKGEVQKTKKELRKLLKCKAGQEEKALEKIRKKVVKDQEEVEELLDDAEGVE